MSNNLPFLLLPFVFNHIENIFLKKVSEIFRCNSNVNVIIHLNGHAHSVTFPDTEASRKNHLVLNMMLGNCVLEQLNDFGRSFQMTG